MCDTRALAGKSVGAKRQELSSRWQSLSRGVATGRQSSPRGRTLRTLAFDITSRHVDARTHGPAHRRGRGEGPRRGGWTRGNRRGGTRAPAIHDPEPARHRRSVRGGDRLVHGIPRRVHPDGALSPARPATRASPPSPTRVVLARPKRSIMTLTERPPRPVPFLTRSPTPSRTIT